MLPAGMAARPDPRTPEDADRLFAERMNAGDVEGLVALYEPAGVLVREDGTPVVGPAALRDELGGILALRPRITMRVTRVVSSGDDLALLYNDWSLTATAPDGSAVALEGRASELVRRQADGTWRYAIDDPYARSRA